MGEGESRVIEYLASHGGVITRAEALAAGIPSATLHRRVNAGHLIRVGHGIYAQPGIVHSERSLLRAATTALDGIASHESAARLHGLDADRLRTVSISVPVRRSNRFDGVVVHQLTDLTADETVEVLGIPTTDPSRTILDLAAVLPAKILAGLLDQSVRIGLTTYDKMRLRLEEKARRGKPGVVKLRELLAARSESPVVLDSTLESRLLGIFVEYDLPKPETQHRPKWLRKMNGRVDLAYPHVKIVVEGDSRRWHGSPEAFQSDRHRDNLAQLAGWIILRFTWEDITTRPSYVAQSVSEALTKRRNSQI